MRWIYWLMGVVIFSVMGGVAIAASPLDGTEWRIKMAMPTAEDQIRFEQRKFISPHFAAKGFANSYYTLTEKEGRPLIWETMQKSENQGTLSWRGDVDSDTMRGVISWETSDGKVVNRTFTGHKVTASGPIP